MVAKTFSSQINLCHKTLITSTMQHNIKLKKKVYEKQTL